MHRQDDDQLCECGKSACKNNAEDVIEVLMKIPEEARLAVKEVTMDLSSSMRAIVSTVFRSLMLLAIADAPRCVEHQFVFSVLVSLV